MLFPALILVFLWINSLYGAQCQHHNLSNAQDENSALLPPLEGSAATKTSANRLVPRAPPSPTRGGKDSKKSTSAPAKAQDQPKPNTSGASGLPKRGPISIEMHEITPDKSRFKAASGGKSTPPRLPNEPQTLDSPKSPRGSGFKQSPPHSPSSTPPGSPQRAQAQSLAGPSSPSRRLKTQQRPMNTIPEIQPLAPLTRSQSMSLDQAFGPAWHPGMHRPSEGPIMPYMTAGRKLKPLEAPWRKSSRTARSKKRIDPSSSSSSAKQETIVPSSKQPSELKRISPISEIQPASSFTSRVSSISSVRRTMSSQRLSTSPGSSSIRSGISRTFSTQEIPSRSSFSDVGSSKKAVGCISNCFSGILGKKKPQQPYRPTAEERAETVRRVSSKYGLKSTRDPGSAANLRRLSKISAASSGDERRTHPGPSTKEIRARRRARGQLLDEPLTFPDPTVRPPLHRHSAPGNLDSPDGFWPMKPVSVFASDEAQSQGEPITRGTGQLPVRKKPGEKYRKDVKDDKSKKGCLGGVCSIM